MDVEDWLDQQEEHEQRQELSAAIDRAQAAGVNVYKVINDCLDGYKNLKRLHKTKKVTTINLSRMLTDQGIYSERHAVLNALKNATEKASQK